MFLTGIFIQGTGMTVLQTAANPYITILGPIESGAKRIAIMGIANKVAGALGSVIFGALLLSGIDEVKDLVSQVSADEKAVLLDQMADSVFVPYVGASIVLEEARPTVLRRIVMEEMHILYVDGVELLSAAPSAPHALAA